MKLALTHGVQGVGVLQPRVPPARANIARACTHTSSSYEPGEAILIAVIYHSGRARGCGCCELLHFQSISKGTKKEETHDFALDGLSCCAPRLSTQHSNVQYVHAASSAELCSTSSQQQEEVVAAGTSRRALFASAISLSLCLAGERQPGLAAGDPNQAPMTADGPATRSMQRLHCSHLHLHQLHCNLDVLNFCSAAFHHSGIPCKPGLHSPCAEQVIVQTELTPNQSLYDPTDMDLVDAALMMQAGQLALSGNEVMYMCLRVDSIS